MKASKKRGIDLSPVGTKGADKREMYGWVTIDKPGEFMLIDKNELKVHPSYQRGLQPAEVKDFTATWSYMSCGALIVARRGGEFWITDGQQRHASAMRRSDIGKLPCLVFETVDVREEAESFLRTNEHRRVVSALDKHRARLVACEELAVFVQETLDALDLRLTTNSSHGAGTIKCIEMLREMARVDRDGFQDVLELAVELTARADVSVGKNLLSGLFYLHRKILDGGVTDKRARARITKVGALKLEFAATKESALNGHGGAKVYASGMLRELDRNLSVRLATKAATS